MNLNVFPATQIKQKIIFVDYLFHDYHFGNDDMQVLSINILIPYLAKVCRAKVTNFLKSDENFARLIISPDENFARKSFAHQYNHSLSK